MRRLLGLSLLALGLFLLIVAPTAVAWLTHTYTVGVGGPGVVVGPVIGFCCIVGGVWLLRRNSI